MIKIKIKKERKRKGSLGIQLSLGRKEMRGILPTLRFL
jgi:hypothetical protein